MLMLAVTVTVTVTGSLSFFVKCGEVSMNGRRRGASCCLFVFVVRIPRVFIVFVFVHFLVASLLLLAVACFCVW